jgi:ADP-dependent NAD(P)H-hydrate dehydratase / NAD(P)H-hydrate epimerase
MGNGSFHGGVRSSRHRALAIILVVLGCLVLGVLGAALYVRAHLDTWIARYAVDEARRRGIELRIGTLSWDLGGVSLGKSTVTPIGVKGVEAKLERVDADVLLGLGRMNVERLEMDGVELTMTGSAPALGLALSVWAKEYAHAFDVRAMAENVALTWRTAPGEPPWLEVSGGNVDTARGSGTLRARQARVGVAQIGVIGAVWTKDSTNITAGLGEPTLAAARVRVRIEHAREPFGVDLVLAPTGLAALEKAFGVKLPNQDIALSGQTHLELPKTLGSEDVTGWTKVELNGFVPPHPPELDGFVFGNTTSFESSLQVDKDQKQVRLHDTRVKAGAFQLRGQGLVVREPDSARLELELNGNLPCAALVGAAAETRLGTTIGQWVRRAAEAALQGSVGVTVKIRADSRNIEDAKMARIIGVGCGLRPLRLPGFEDIELPGLGKLPPLDKVLPKLPTKLPTIGPAGLPSIPTFPTNLPKLPAAWPSRPTAPR